MPLLYKLSLQAKKVMQRILSLNESMNRLMMHPGPFPLHMLLCSEFYIIDKTQ